MTNFDPAHDPAHDPATSRHHSACDRAGAQEGDPDKALPIVHTQTDLHGFWSMLMGDLGFSYSRLYVAFLPPGGRADGLAAEIAELPDVPEPEITAGLLRMCRVMIDDVGFPEDVRVAFLYARPGRGGITPSDRAWGWTLVDAARRQGVPIWPVHVANDHELRVLAPDDLALPA